VRPASGWPLVIFQHGITRNRSDMFAIAATLAGQGFAVVAVDPPPHGLNDKHHPVYREKPPLGPAPRCRPDRRPYAATARHGGLGGRWETHAGRSAAVRHQLGAG
jgi:pimeloyl-ACP methyl ester carboxylesterase